MSKPIIKRSYKGIEDDLIYRYVSIGSYFPAVYSISVYDRGKDNVLISDWQFDVANGVFPIFDDIETIPVKEIRTITSNQLREIESLILESGVLNIRCFDVPDYVVMDGTSERIYFCVNGKRKYIEGDNIFNMYENNSDITIISDLVDEIDNIIKIFNNEGENVK